MSDLLDELRLIGCHSNGDARCTCGIGQDAADEIERLRGALEQIWQVAAYADCDDRAAREWIEVHARDYLDTRDPK